MRQVFGHAVLPVLPVLLVGLAACSGQPATPSPAAAPPSLPVASAPPSAVPTNGPAPTPTPKSAQPELVAKPLQHSVTASGLTVNIVYTPDAPVTSWTAENAKPVQVSVTVVNNRRPRQKVFLTRASMRFGVNDGSNDGPGPDPLVDTANIDPGYLASFPYSYVQSFAIPALDVGSRRLTVDLKLELVSLVDAKANDYTKQTITDTFRVTLPAN